MDLRNGQLTVGELLRQPSVRSEIQRKFPNALTRPLPPAMLNMPLQRAASMAQHFIPPQQVNMVISQLKKL